MFIRKNHGRTKAITRHAIKKLQNGCPLQHPSPLFDMFPLLSIDLPSFHSSINRLSPTPSTFLAVSPQISHILHWPKSKIIVINNQQLIWQYDMKRQCSLNTAVAYWQACRSFGLFSLYFSHTNVQKQTVDLINVKPLNTQSLLQHVSTQQNYIVLNLGTLCSTIHLAMCNWNAKNSETGPYLYIHHWLAQT